MRNECTIEKTKLNGYNNGKSKGWIVLRLVNNKTSNMNSNNGNGSSSGSSNNANTNEHYHPHPLLICKTACKCEDGVRIELAAAYRVFAALKWTHLIHTYHRESFQQSYRRIV